MGMFLRRGTASSGQKLGDLAPLTIIKLNENGAPIEFYVAKHDYEPDLNGAGRTLLVRKDCYDTRIFGSTNALSGSGIDTFANGTWLDFLDANIRAAIGTTKFYYTPGGSDFTVSTLERAVFLLSCAELGSSSSGNAEGTPLDTSVRNKLSIAYLSGNAVNQWTRTPMTIASMNAVFYADTTGVCRATQATSSGGGFRPVFTLPSNFKITDDMLA